MYTFPSVAGCAQSCSRALHTPHACRLIFEHVSIMTSGAVVDRPVLCEPSSGTTKGEQAFPPINFVYRHLHDALRGELDRLADLVHSIEQRAGTEDVTQSLHVLRERYHLLVQVNRYHSSVEDEVRTRTLQRCRKICNKEIHAMQLSRAQRCLRFGQRFALSAKSAFAGNPQHDPAGGLSCARVQGQKCDAFPTLSSMARRCGALGLQLCASNAACSSASVLPMEDSPHLVSVPVHAKAELLLAP